jgi:two-component system chemotaxis response regulator CheY
MSRGLALVIEDDYDASVIFAKAMEVLGFEPDVIRTGDVARQKLTELVPIIVILDLHLPEVVGTDLLRQIRDDPRLTDTWVIVASADPRMAEMIRDVADLVLIKPTTFSQVRDLAARLTSLPRSQSKRRTRRLETHAANLPKREEHTQAD